MYARYSDQPCDIIPALTRVHHVIAISVFNVVDVLCPIVAEVVWCHSRQGRFLSLSLRSMFSLSHR